MITEQNQISHFFEGWKGKRLAVIGVGVSNNDVIRMLARKGLNVTLCDRKSREQLGDLAEEFAALGVKFRLGDEYLNRLTDFDIILRAPGVYFYRPELAEARKAGCVVTSELEVFFRLCPCPVYAVTGSDGKTTTTTLISEMLKAEGKTVHLGGNIGKALLPMMEQVQPDDRVVAELSSFQLLSMRFAPQVSVVTNVSPNHLDVHGTMEEYIDAKKNIFLHQDAFSRTVLNLDNETAFSFAPCIRGNLWSFSRQEQPAFGAYADEKGDIYVCGREGRTFVMNQSEIRIPGLHNVENYLAAISAVWGEVSPDTIRKIAREFGGVEHRIEFVRELDGVKWYNDSIASSPSRTVAGLKAFQQKIILLAGGYDKKIPFESMVPYVIDKVKALILMGLTAPKIEAAVRAGEGCEESKLPIYHAENLEDAVRIAREISVGGDIVSLSPACASFDAFPNFEVRGRRFKELVGKL